MPRQNPPSYRLHKPPGQAVVTLHGKMFYLGQYKSKKSRAKYNAIIADFLANNCKLSSHCHNLFDKDGNLRDGA